MNQVSTIEYSETPKPSSKVVKIPINEALELYPTLENSVFYYRWLLNRMSILLSNPEKKILLLGGSVRNSLRYHIKPEYISIRNEYDFFVKEEISNCILRNAPFKYFEDKHGRSSGSFILSSVNHHIELDIVPVKNTDYSFESITDKFDFTVNCCGIDRDFLYYTEDFMRDIKCNELNIVSHEHIYGKDRFDKFEKNYKFELSEESKAFKETVKNTPDYPEF